jgi:hypothetical protein
VAMRNGQRSSCGDIRWDLPPRWELHDKNPTRTLKPAVSQSIGAKAQLLLQTGNSSERAGELAASSGLAAKSNALWTWGSLSGPATRNRLAFEPGDCRGLLGESSKSLEATSDALISDLMMSDLIN